MWTSLARHCSSITGSDTGLETWRGPGWGSSILQHRSTNWLANERPRIKFPGKSGKTCENTGAGAGKAAKGKLLFSGLGKFLMASYTLPVYA